MACLRFFKEEKTVQNKAIAVLKENNYVFMKSLGSGVFGDVIKCKSIKRRESVAVKIVPTCNVRKKESEIWKQLLHPNILPLFSFMKYPEFEVFIMPLAKYSLNNCMKDKSFRRKTSSFHTVITWLRDVITGMKYLHEVGVCHLDAKIDNVLITYNNKATLSDFSCTNTTENKVVGYGLLPPFRPPETCPYTGQWRTDGVPFDLWSYGVMILHVLAYEWIEDKFSDTDIYWHRQAYPKLFQVVQMSVFEEVLQSTFPNLKYHNFEVALALNLIQSILRYHPWNRPQASLILRHPFLSKGIGSTILEPDEIWSIDHNEKGLFSSLDAERPSTMPKKVQVIKSRKSSEEIIEIKVLEPFRCGDKDEFSTKITSCQNEPFIVEKEQINVDHDVNENGVKTPNLNTFVEGTENLPKDVIVSDNQTTDLKPSSSKKKTYFVDKEIFLMTLDHYNSKSLSFLQNSRMNGIFNRSFNESTTQKSSSLKDVGTSKRGMKDANERNVHIHKELVKDNLIQFHDDSSFTERVRHPDLECDEDIEENDSREENIQMKEQSVIELISKEYNLDSFYKGSEKDIETSSKTRLIYNKSNSLQCLKRKEKTFGKTKLSFSDPMLLSAIPNGEFQIKTSNGQLSENVPEGCTKSVCGRVRDWLRKKCGKYCCLSCFTTNSDE